MIALEDIDPQKLPVGWDLSEDLWQTLGILPFNLKEVSRADKAAYKRDATKLCRLGLATATSPSSWEITPIGVKALADIKRKITVSLPVTPGQRPWIVQMVATQKALAFLKEQVREVSRQKVACRVAALWLEAQKRPAGWQDFIRERGDDKVRSPDTGNYIKIKSLRGTEGSKILIQIYERWSENKKRTNPSSEKEKSPSPKEEKNTFDPAKYKDWEVTKTYFKPEKHKDLLSKLNIESDDPHIEHKLADIIGCSAITPLGSYEIELSSYEGGIDIIIRGNHIRDMIRRVAVSNGKPTIYNQSLYLSDDAPKGLGTKLLSTQVDSAKSNGIKQIECDAYRDRERPDWIGYKVWAKLGFDGEIPFGEGYGEVKPLPKDLEEKIQKAGFKKPYKVSHLYQVEGGQDWWDENGESFDAVFDLSENSTSMQVLNAYIKAKAKQENKTTKDWMKVSTKQKSKSEKDKHENIDLGKDDHDLLNKIWKDLADKNKKDAK